MQKLRVFEAFSGYGSQRIALRNIGVNHEVVGISEINKYAEIAYTAIHGPVRNFGDIKNINVNDVPDHDLFTYSFPCQDISNAGYMRGIVKNETRSGLLYECEKIIEFRKPKFLMLENVKNLVSSRFFDDFNKWLLYLENMGYSNFWHILNAKNHSVPQHRERVFVISILDKNAKYTPPNPVKLSKCINDMLEENVDSKYYLNDRLLKNFIPLPIKHVPNDSVKVVGFIKKSDSGTKHQSNTVIDSNYIMRTLTAGDFKCPQLILLNDNRIRRLTPREEFRFMGVSEMDIDKIVNAGISNTQQYIMAGNSIVVPMLEQIFKNLLHIDK